MHSTAAAVAEGIAGAARAVEPPPASSKGVVEEKLKRQHDCSASAVPAAPAAREVSTGVTVQASLQEQQQRWRHSRMRRTPVGREWPLEKVQHGVAAGGRGAGGVGAGGATSGGHEGDCGGM